MGESLLKKLELCAPLVYIKTDNLPSVLTENDEFLLCFDLDPIQSRSIEPKPEEFLGSLAFSGKNGDIGSLQVQKVMIPAGMYLFTQCRGPVCPLSLDKWLNMAIEQQKDGLWERHQPGNRLYVRFFHEDGAFVTQIFRVILEHQ